MLEDVEDARVVGGRRLERDGERLVRIVVLQVEQLRPALAVVEHEGGAVDLRQLFARAHGEAVQLLVDAQIHADAFPRMRVPRLPHCLTRTAPGAHPPCSFHRFRRQLLLKGQPATAAPPRPRAARRRNARGVRKGGGPAPQVERGSEGRLIVRTRPLSGPSIRRGPQRGPRASRDCPGGLTRRSLRPAPLRGQSICAVPGPPSS